MALEPRRTAPQPLPPRNETGSSADLLLGVFDTAPNQLRAAALIDHHACWSTVIGVRARRLAHSLVVSSPMRLVPCCLRIVSPLKNPCATENRPVAQIPAVVGLLVFELFALKSSAFSRVRMAVRAGFHLEPNPVAHPASLKSVCVSLKREHTLHRTLHPSSRSDDTSPPMKRGSTARHVSEPLRVRFNEVE